MLHKKLYNSLRMNYLFNNQKIILLYSYSIYECHLDMMHVGKE